MQSNPNYAEAFAYVGPHVKDRSEYIKDCDDGDGHEDGHTSHNDGDEHISEQSDLVLIILNMGALPK